MGNVVRNDIFQREKKPGLPLLRGNNANFSESSCLLNVSVRQRTRMMIDYPVRQTCPAKEVSVIQKDASVSKRKDFPFFFTYAAEGGILSDRGRRGNLKQIKSDPEVYTGPLFI